MQVMPVSFVLLICSACLLPPFFRQPYAAASSLTTRRTHLGKAHLPEYLALIETCQLPNKLPNFLKQKREEQRARDSARTTFSAKALEDQLLKVIVANDLVCPNQPSWSYILSRAQVH